MKFYDCHITPNPRRARIFIAEKGLEVPLVEVAPGVGHGLAEIAPADGQKQLHVGEADLTALVVGFDLHGGCLRRTQLTTYSYR